MMDKMVSFHSLVERFLVGYASSIIQGYKIRDELMKDLCPDGVKFLKFVEDYCRTSDKIKDMRITKHRKCDYDDVAYELMDKFKRESNEDSDPT